MPQSQRKIWIFNLHLQNNFPLSKIASKVNADKNDGQRSEKWGRQIKPSFYPVTNLVKFYSMLGGNERHPKGDLFGKQSFPSEAWSANKTEGKSGN